MFDRLSTQYTGTSKHRRAIAEKKGQTNGTHGSTSRKHGTGKGHGSSWLDAGMHDVEFRGQSYNSIGSRRGSAGRTAVNMKSSTTSRFRNTSASGSYLSRADIEEAAARDITYDASSCFKQAGQSKSMFGMSVGYGMGGNPTTDRFRARSSSGHYISRRDQEEAARRKLSYISSTDTAAALSEMRSSSFHAASKSMGTSARLGMGMGGSSSRFRAQTSSGHYRSKADLHDAQVRGDTDTSTGLAMSSSSFSSAMKKGNPRYSIMGGTTSRFGGAGSIYMKGSADIGPGCYPSPYRPTGTAQFTKP